MASLLFRQHGASIKNTIPATRHDIHPISRLRLNEEKIFTTYSQLISIKKRAEAKGRLSLSPSNKNPSYLKKKK
jgi:hypothetical protein